MELFESGVTYKFSKDKCKIYKDEEPWMDLINDYIFTIPKNNGYTPYYFININLSHFYIMIMPQWCDRISRSI